MRSHSSASFTDIVKHDLNFSPQEFHESLHSLLLWLAHAESRRYTVDISHPDTSIKALQQHHSTLTVGSYYHIFAIIYHLAHHRHHFWLLRFCRICGRSCSAGRASRPPSRLCGRSSSPRRRPTTAARPGRNSTWRAVNWSYCWGRWTRTSASWNNDWWGLVNEQLAAVLTLWLKHFDLHKSIHWTANKITCLKSRIVSLDLPKVRLQLLLRRPQAQRKAPLQKST